MHDRTGTLPLAKGPRYQPDLLIKRWQQTIQLEDNEPYEKSLVAKLCEQCSCVFREFIYQQSKDSNISQHVSVSLKRCYDSLKLWDNAFEVSQGKLNSILERNNLAMRATVRILINIARALTESPLPTYIYASDKFDSLTAELRQTLREVPRSTYDDNKSTDDDDDDDDSDDDNDRYRSIELGDFRELAKDLSSSVSCLMDLEPLYNSPAPEPEPELPTASIFVEWKPEQSYCDRITQRFPNAEERLVLRLGTASYNRYLRCREERETVDEREDDTLQGVASGMESSVCTSKFHDSGHGTSVLTNDDAEAVMSYSQREGNPVRIPPLSEDAKNGLPFHCLVCGKHVTIFSNSEWKKHLISDLKPYLCLEMSCPFDGVFGNFNEWLTHVTEHHSVPAKSSCPLCSENIGHGFARRILHLRRHLEEISLSELPSGLAPGSESEGSLTSISSQCIEANVVLSEKKGLSNPIADVTSGGDEDSDAPTGHADAKDSNVGFSETELPVHPIPFTPYYLSSMPDSAASVFKNSHYNVAHYSNMHFQPELYRPDAEEECQNHRTKSRKREVHEGRDY
ncbi:hypothetical protein F5Y19DRAFT_27271 [Xylariaceae sp. FL1651]|nr:hypothetical protein F5Y19DRAFT_27271 [Xylariaceae sp. FL1651]